MTALEGNWLERFPEQAINFELADFSFWRIVPRDARFVAGFGRIHNLSAGDLAAGRGSLFRHTCGDRPDLVAVSRHAVSRNRATRKPELFTPAGILLLVGNI